MWTIAGCDDASVRSQDEYDALVGELYRSMFIVAYSMTRNRYEAMDIVQEAWLKILRKSDSLRDTSKLTSWAKAVVTNTGLNVIRKKYRNNEVSLEAISAGEWVRSEDQLEELLLLRRVLWESLDSLPADLRTVLVNKFFDGLRDREIAERLSLPIGTVKAKIHRAKQRMRKQLEESDMQADLSEDSSEMM